MVTRSNGSRQTFQEPGKSGKPFGAWLCFFLGLIIVGGCVLSAAALVVYSEGDWETLKAPFADYQDTRMFRERTRYYFSYISSLADNSTQEVGHKEWVLQLLGNEGENLRYCVVEEGDRILASNIDGDLSSLIGPDNVPVLPDGYGYCWYFDGQKVRVFDNGAPVDTERLDSGYRSLIPDLAPDEGDTESTTNVRILMAVRNVIVENPYGHSRYHTEQQCLFIVGRVVVAISTLGITLLAYGIVRRKEKRAFDLRLASWSGRLWFEVKLVLSVLALYSALMLTGGLLHHGDSFAEVAAAAGVLIVAAWWGYVMLADLTVNRKQFFAHNSFNSLLRLYRRYERQYSWQRMMLRRAYALMAAETALVLLAFLSLVEARHISTFLPIMLLIVGVGLYLAYRYLRRYGSTVEDLGRLTDHIRRIKDGDMETTLDVAADADIYPAAQDLNGIQEGIGRAVSEKVKSERMKVELITNVSHDLKTPLTSMMSYVDLLSKESGLPEHVNDYVKILAQKTERLKNLIQDLFELSKATSNDIALNMERIDLVRLVRQVLADMEEPIGASGLGFRVNTPDEPVYTISDGDKLYRVLQNLISNAVKYSLQGSRVFIDLTAGHKQAKLTIKNTANYQMDFDDEAVLQRFARGDQSRSTEGSGLGLSIAQSFTEACGGRFAVTIDGDLFKVELRFETD